MWSEADEDDDDAVFLPWGPEDQTTILVLHELMDMIEHFDDDVSSWLTTHGDSPEVGGEKIRNCVDSLRRHIADVLDELDHAAWDVSNEPDSLDDLEF